MASLKKENTWSLTKQWNGVDITEAYPEYKPIVLSLSTGRTDETIEFINVDIDVPFNFTGTKPPNSVPGEPYPGLWDYEVVELFLANSKNEYVELEWAPGQEHIVLFLKGERDTIRHSLPLTFTVTHQPNGWKGKSEIPADYLPPNVTKMNAYAIFEKKKDQNSTVTKIYCAHSPSTDKNQTGPNFHLLQYFVQLDTSVLPEMYKNRTVHSTVWQEAFDKKRSFLIDKLWNGTSTSTDLTSSTGVVLSANSTSINIVWYSRYFNDSAVNSNPSYEELFGSESFGIYFRNQEATLDLVFGVGGSYSLRMLKGQSNVSLDTCHLKKIPYKVDKEPFLWRGEATVPATYFPANVSHFNAYSAHGSADAATRVLETLFKISNATNEAYLKSYGAADFGILIPSNVGNYSEVWKEAESGDACGLGTTSVSNFIAVISAAIALLVTSMV